MFSSLPLPVGDIQFYDNYLPAFKDGTYTIKVSASVTYDGDKVGTKEVKDNSNDLPDISQNFAVSGPRFSIGSEDIHATYPPQNSSGQFETHLPYMIFNKRVLPWERALGPSADKEIPWVALLVFEEGELDVLPNVTSTKAFTRTVKDWQNDATVFKAKGLSFDTSELDQNCQFIQIQADIFRKLVPHLSELKYLTHCRQINTGGQETLGINDTGWFAVTVSNRFPKAPEAGQSTNIVHLVSLEGLADSLEDATITEPLQLISLASWTFTCLPDPKENFEGLMDNIATEESTNKGTLTLPLESGVNVPPAINQYFSRGYAPLTYQTRTAENAFAWYKGPLTPNAIAPTPVLEISSKTGNAAIIYDEQNGVFDLSYAAAWQLGRSLALQDANFTQTLMQLRLQQKKDLYTKLRESEIAEITDTVPSMHGKPLNKLILHAFASGLKEHVQGVSTHNYVAQEQLRAPKMATVALTRFEKYKQRVDRLKALHHNIAVDPEPLSIPSSLIDWVNQLVLLKGIPFQYLVPHNLMLPSETIRFFYVDPNWIDRLIDGAFSIGLHCEQDITFNEQIKTQVKKSINAYPVSGFLLRSQVVSGWPGLLVRIDDTDDPSDILRKDLLASTVFFVLFQKNPSEQIQICQPREQLSFGVEGDNLTTNAEIVLRAITGADLGKALGPTQTLQVENYLRVGDRVLNIGPSINPPPSPKDTTLLTAFKTTFQKDLSPAEMAIQFVRSPLDTPFKISKSL